MNRQLRVTKVPPSITRDSLLFFFENKRKCGGGEVKDVDYDEDNRVAIITFVEDGVVETVVNNSKATPFLLEQKIIDVAPHVMQTDGDDAPQHCIIGEEESGDFFAVIVTGYDPQTTSDETLQLYFEGKRGANAEVLEIKRPDNETSVILRFEHETDVDTILKKSHTIGGREIQVKRYVAPKPLPKYEDKVFITGINPSTTKDSLCNFLEAKSTVEPSDITYGEEDGSALASFTENIDIRSLTEKCRTRALEGSFLTVKEVTVTDTILITDFSDTTTEETFLLYFENKRRSGVDEVKKIQMSKEERQCFISFPDHNDVNIVCKRKHTIEGATLNIQAHHPCLGNPLNIAQSLQFTVPSPFVTNHIDAPKLAFLSKNENQLSFGKIIGAKYGRVNWSKTTDSRLEIECILQQSMKDCRKLSREWSRTIERTVQSYIDGIGVVEISTLHETLEVIRNDINSLEKEHVVVSIDEESNSVFVVGIPQSIEEIVEKINALVHNAERKIDEMKNRVEERLKTKKYETDILSAIKFQDQFIQERDGVVVEIDVQDNYVRLTGKATQIINAKLKVIEKVREIEHKVVEEVSKGMLDFLQIDEVKSFVDHQLLDGRVISSWTVTDDNKVIMYALSDEDLVTAIQIFRNSVSSSTVDVNKGQKEILQTLAWNELIKQIQATSVTKTIRVFASDNKISIFCTSKQDIGTLREIIADYLYNNQKKQHQTILPLAQKRFIQEHCRDELLRDLQDEGLRIDFNDVGILMSGTESALSEAKNKIDKLRKDIVSKQQVIEKAGIVQHMESPEGKAKISQTERQNKVVILIGEDDGNEEEQLEEEESHQMRTAECSVSTGQKIITVFGDITELKADVLVNAANKKLDHCGGLARIIVQKGGQIIQTECSSILKEQRRNTLNDGEVVCSGAGKLPFAMIAHVVSPPYQEGFHGEDHKLAISIETALEMTAAKDYRSIAISAVGTSMYGFPINIACTVIVDAIKDFFKSNKNASIQEVFLCDIQESTVQEFVVALKRKFSISNVKEFAHEAKTKEKGQHKMENDLDTDVASFDIVPSPNLINISLVQGVLAKQEVNVIVNSTSKDLKLTHGAVSTSLLKTGGEILQTQCTKNYPNGVIPGEVAVTSGGKLQCEKVYHGALNQWSSDAPKELEMFMTNCLETASKSGFECLAFPALGTGNLGYPKEEAAKLMFSSVEKFGRTNPKTTVVDVRFVIYEKDQPVLKAFQDEQQQHKSRNQGQSTKKKASSSQKQVNLDFDHATLKVYNGDLCTAIVGVIVNCTDINFTSKPGSTSAVIFKKGGDDLSREIRTHGRHMKKDKISITTAGRNFGSEFIIHLDVEDTATDLKTKIRLVIEKMEEFGQHSIAFPINDLGDATKVGSSLNDVLRDFNGKTDIEVHGIVNDSQLYTELLNVLQTATTQSQSIVSRFAGWVGIGGKPRRKPKLQISNVQQLSRILVTVFGKSYTNISQALRTLESSLESAFKTQYVEDMLIKTLPKHEIDELESQLQSCGVEYEVNRRDGTIRLTGLPDNILLTVNVIHTQLRQAEDMRHTREHADLLSEMVQWYYIEVESDGEKLVAYPMEVNGILEKAVRENKTQADFRDKDGNVYIVDFNSYTEYQKANPKDAVKVIRRNKVTGDNSEIPATWSFMKPDENIKLVSLLPTDIEYRTVAREFKKTVQNTIKKIQKIQNRTLYQQYMAKKKSMDSENKSGKVIERTLWHGTKYNALDSINTYGFNRSYCGQNAVVWGNGVYFARDASYSARTMYSPVDHNNQRHMYMCKVLTGDFTLGKKGLIVPPQKQSSGHLLYDCVVDDVNNPGIFVIFHDTQAYPEYLILFE